MPFPVNRASESRLRVRYAETDRMGVVYYANYLVWMEVGRVDLCKAVGFNYRDMENEDGIFLAVAESHCRYRSPARFDDEVTVKTWIEEANSRIVKFAYEMSLTEDGRVLAAGHTRHVFVNQKMQRARLPRKYYEMFGLTE
jgi:acyl-CoA thioester hydrolase